MSEPIADALNKKFEKDLKEAKEYSEMLDELDNAIGVKTLELIEEHDKIVKKYGFEESFIEFVKGL